MGTIGHIRQVIGPTVDIEFPSDHLPNILNAVHVKDPGREQLLTVEVAQHLGDNNVRCIAMDNTDGLVRGMEAEDTGAPIAVPVGEQCLGRIFNLLGDTIDGKGPISDPRTPHAYPPSASGLRRTAAGHPTFRDRHQGSSIFWLRTPKAAKSACSAARASARPSSSWN